MVWNVRHITVLKCIPLVPTNTNKNNQHLFNQTWGKHILYKQHGTKIDIQQHQWAKTGTYHPYMVNCLTLFILNEFRSVQSM